jgi:hypothetical protein
MVLDVAHGISSDDCDFERAEEHNERLKALLYLEICEIVSSKYRRKAGIFGV